MAESTIRDSNFDVALGVLRRRKWVGVIALTATLSLAVPLVVFLPDVYRGVATVLVENQDASSALVRASIPELETRLITIQQELLSRARLSDLIARLDLYAAWRRRGEPMEGLAERLRRDIRVELSRNDRGRPTTSGLKISYIGLDAKSAAAVPNALATLYVEENSRIRERQTGHMADFLKSQLETARQAVLLQEARLNRFKRQRAGHLPEQVTMNLVTLERLNTRLRMNSDEQSRLRERQDRIAGATPAREEASDLQTLKQRLADLQSKFTDKHPDVIRTKAQIVEAERQRAIISAPAAPASPTHSGGGSEAELASLQREERVLRSEIVAYEQRIHSAPEVEQELEALERDYDVAKESYGSIQKRYDEAQLAVSLEQSKNAESFRVLDSAIVPLGPAAPNRMRLLIMAFFFAVASGIGAMLLTEHLDTSFHSVGELRQFTSIPVLATIPFVPSRTTLSAVLRVAATTIAVIGMCVLLAGFAYRAARGNTQLVWMLSAPQL